jgi:hypothetical protein
MAIFSGKLPVLSRAKKVKITSKKIKMTNDARLMDVPAHRYPAEMIPLEG